MFVWVWGFAWLVWLLCACGVRRFRGLWRVCLYFVLFCPLSCPLLCPFALVFAFLFVLFAPAFISFPAFLGLSSWLLGFCSWSCPFSLWVVVVSFFLADVWAKERARRVGASSLRGLWVALSGCCFIFLVLVRCQPVYIVIKF